MALKLAEEQAEKEKEEMKEEEASNPMKVIINLRIEIINCCGQ